MKVFDLRLKHVKKLLKRILTFLSKRLLDSENLVTKDISFQIFDKYDKISKLLHDLKAKGLKSSQEYSPNLDRVLSSLESTFLGDELIDYFMLTLENSWQYLENKFGENIDISDIKKEVSIKIKCQSHSEFSNDLEDVTVLVVMLFEEFSRLVDCILEILSLVFLNEKLIAEFKLAEKLDLGRDFRKLPSQYGGHALMTDFFQKNIRYLISINEAFETSIKIAKNYKNPKPKAEVILDFEFNDNFCEVEKKNIYKSYVQNKIKGLLSMAQKKSDLEDLELFDHYNMMSNDFLSKLVSEINLISPPGKFIQPNFGFV